MPRMYIYICPDYISVDEIKKESIGNFLTWPERTIHPTKLIDWVDTYVDAFYEDHQDWHVVTYSSLFVLRIQRNILKGRIAPTEVSIVFPEKLNGSGRLTFQSSSFDHLGSPSGYWPQTLFKEEVEQARQILEIQSKIISAKNNATI